MLPVSLMLIYVVLYCSPSNSLWSQFASFRVLCSEEILQVSYSTIRKIFYYALISM